MKKKTLPELKSCGLLIYRRSPESQFLLMKHADRWDLPKGHVDPGETELQCALRETREETGLEPDWLDVDPKFRFEARYRVKSRRVPGRLAKKTLVIFLARLASERHEFPLVMTEHLGYEWFAWRPPHAIQAHTIDPLLEYAASVFPANGP